MTTTTAQPTEFAYLLYTVNAFRVVNQRVVWGTSADEIAEAAMATGYYRKVEVAPASPVNGFDGLPHRSHDTASR